MHRIKKKFSLTGFFDLSRNSAINDKNYLVALGYSEANTCNWSYSHNPFTYCFNYVMTNF
jgi:hypothetical protein